MTPTQISNTVPPTADISREKMVGGEREGTVAVEEESVVFGEEGLVV